jgi:dsDNA-specific endonuclease/ATPase MutS2
MLWLLVILVLVLAGILWLRQTPQPPPETGDASGASPQPETEPAAVPVGDSLDLHGLPPEEVGAVVDAYVEEARRLGFRQVKIIHGRGIGVARRTVRVHLDRSPHVLHYHDAAPPSGIGATIAILQPEERDIATPSHPH